MTELELAAAKQLIRLKVEKQAEERVQLKLRQAARINKGLLVSLDLRVTSPTQSALRALPARFPPDA